MITLVCTKCGATLTVDDGFAGGVCRCNRCGTIQTVPKLGQNHDGGEAIFERAKRNSNRELEALGEVVSSSGLAGSGMLRQSGAPADVVKTDAARRRRSFVASFWGAGVAIAIGVWLTFFRPGTPTENVSDTPDAASTPDASPKLTSTVTPTARLNGPSFGPIALNASGTVVYLVDRGDATRAFTAALQHAVVKSVATLGANRKFQVQYWMADGESPAFPTTPGEANSSNVGRLAGWMADVPGGRSTDASASMDAALAVKPAEIVILTGKAWQLDDSFANESIVKLTGSGVKVHAVALGGSSGSEALARITAKTGGTFVEMDEPTLSAVGGK